MKNKKAKAKIIPLNPAVQQRILESVFMDLNDLDQNLDTFFDNKHKLKTDREQ